MEQYKVTGRSGATVRLGEPLDSPIQCTLTPGTIVEVSEVRGRWVVALVGKGHAPFPGVYGAGDGADFHDVVTWMLLPHGNGGSLTRPPFRQLIIVCSGLLGMVELRAVRDRSTSHVGPPEVVTEGAAAVGMAPSVRRRLPHTMPFPLAAR